MNRPRLRFAATLALPLLLGACGEVFLSYTSGSTCPPDPDPAVVVRFVSAFDARPVAVVAAGTTFDGVRAETMAREDRRYAGTDRTFSLAGGFGRAGIYDVDVQTSSGERFVWRRIEVPGDYCGPFTVFLQAPVREP